jgi:hypothetical protein
MMATRTRRPGSIRVPVVRNDAPRSRDTADPHGSRGTRPPAAPIFEARDGLWIVAAMWSGERRDSDAG